MFTTSAFFFVVTMSTAPSNIPIKVMFDPDGYTSEYNEIENADTDNIIRIEPGTPVFGDVQLIPEFHLLALPLLALFLVLVLVVRRKFRF